MNNISKPGKMFVQLASTIDPLRYIQLSSNQQLEEVSKPHGCLYYEVSSLCEARQLCLDYIQRLNLGGSGWAGGRIIDENHNFIARISYNGRVWSDEEFKNSKEIII